MEGRTSGQTGRRAAGQRRGRETGKLFAFPHKVWDDAGESDEVAEITHPFRPSSRLNPTHLRCR